MPENIKVYLLGFISFLGCMLFAYFCVVNMCFPNDLSNVGWSILFIMFVVSMALISIFAFFVFNYGSTEYEDKIISEKSRLDLPKTISRILHQYNDNYKGLASDKGILYALLKKILAEYELAWSKLGNVTDTFAAENMYFSSWQHSNKIIELTKRVIYLLNHFDFGEYAYRCAQADRFSESYVKMVCMLEESLNKIRNEYEGVNNELGELLLSAGKIVAVDNAN
jgi:hypothetical protein